MKIAYYPGCTLKTRAKNLEDAALAALRVLGIAAVELPRWNCCGAVYSLTDDDLIHQVAPVRDLIRVKEQGAETVMTLCSMCYNTLARANRLMREDEEKRHTLNTFMDEEPDYHGEVEVHHLLTLLRDRIGWKTLAAKVRRPLTGLKVAPYYGCTLVRPRPVSIDPRPDQPTILDDFLRALGAEPVDYPARIECCGAYNILSEPDAAHRASANVLASAERHGAELVITSC
ncbi:MAG: heterodisulfide reductase, subunit B, partial [Deltaproteobacteria bacterium RIFOXYD2_FULL_66_9]